MVALFLPETDYFSVVNIPHGRRAAENNKTLCDQ
jgi:hypothetical protein